MASTRGGKICDETPFEYLPLKDEADSCAGRRTRARIKDYNLKDLGI